MEDLIKDLKLNQKERETWDKHEKLFLITSKDQIFISFKSLDPTKGYHQEVKSLFEPFGKDQNFLEGELMDTVIQIREQNNTSLAFKDGLIDYNKVPSEFLLERIKSATENTKIFGEDIMELSKNFENGYEMTIGKCFYLRTMYVINLTPPFLVYYQDCQFNLPK